MTPPDRDMTPPDDDPKPPGGEGKPPELSQAAINQVFESLQSAPSVESATTGAASAVRGLGSLLTSNQSAATDPSDAHWQALEDMTLPPRHAERLKPLLGKIDLDLKEDSVPDPYDATISRRFTAVVGRGTEIAVLHLPEMFLHNYKAIGIFREGIANVWSRHGRLISETNWIHPGFRKALQTDPPKDRSWMFVQWNDIQTVFSGQMKVEDSLVLGTLLSDAKKNGAAAPLPVKTLDDDVKEVVAILARQAIVTKEYFKGLVDKSDWSDALKGKVQGQLSGDPTKDAQALINILRAANLYGANHPTRKGDSFLGWVLLSELDGLGDPDGATLAKIVIDRGLVQQKEGLDIAKARLGGG